VPARLTADVQVTDPAVYEPYRSLAAANIARFGNRFIVRGIRQSASRGRLFLVEGAD